MSDLTHQTMKLCDTCGIPPITRVDTLATPTYTTKCENYRPIFYDDTLSFSSPHESFQHWNQYGYKARHPSVMKLSRPVKALAILESREYRLDPVAATLIKKSFPERREHIKEKITHPALVVLNALNHLQQTSEDMKKLPDGIWNEVVNACCELVLMANDVERSWG